MGKRDRSDVTPRPSGARPVRLAGWIAAVLAGGPAQALTFDQADIFYELNATARDVGVQVSLDAENWKTLHIEGPGGAPVVTVTPQGNVGRIGLSELFFEGDEPSLAKVPFSRLRRLVPPGVYTFTGRTNANQPLRSTDRLTADLPCPVPVLSPREDENVAANALTVRWRSAPGIYDPDRRICDTSRNVGLTTYQVIVVIDNPRRKFHRELQADLPRSARQLHVPPGFLSEAASVPGTEFNLEVLAIEDSGNKTITERSFGVTPITPP